MKPNAACPDVSSLKALLEESHDGEQDESFATHLETCRACQDTLEALTGSHSLSTALSQHLPFPADDEPALWKAIAQLEQLDEPLASVDRLPADLGQGFLSPTDEPGSLGRVAHYEVTSIIGLGGVGVVLKARDQKLGRVVALKVLAPQIAASETARQRFIREARTAAGVRSQHVVTIFAVEEHRGQLFLAMEYVAGHSLQEELDHRGPLPLPEVLRIGAEIAEGLAAAHAQGLVHRDIKPGNILLEEGTETVKITDFGLALAVDDARLTRQGVVAGTPQYMAPEQAEGKTADSRSDLFSLGSVLYAICTGRPPFEAENSIAILKQVSEQAPSPVRELNPKTPDSLAAMIEKLHAKNPDDRFESAAEVAALLRQHLAHLQQPALVPMPPSLRRPLPTRQHPMVAAAVAAAIFMVAAVGLWQIVIRITDKDGNVTETTVADDAKIELVKDGAVIASIPDNNITNTSVSIRRFEKHSGIVHGVALSRDGTRIFVGRRDGSLQLLDATGGDELRAFPGHDEWVRCVALSPNGQLALSCSRDKFVRLWNVETGAEVRRFEGHTEGISKVAFSPDGQRALSSSEDKTLRLWKVETGEELCRLEGHTGGVLSFALSADGRRALSGSQDWTMRLWDLERGSELHRFEGHETWVWSVALSADGRFAVSGSGTHSRDADGRPYDCLVRLWDVDSGKLLRKFFGHAREISSLAFCDQGRQILSASADGKVYQWDRDQGDLVHRFIGHKAEVASLSLAVDERHFVTGGHDGAVLVWEMPNKR
jgi:serine/threonine protein kinase